MGQRYEMLSINATYNYIPLTSLFVYSYVILFNVVCQLYSIDRDDGNDLDIADVHQASSTFSLDSIKYRPFLGILDKSLVLLLN